MSKIVLKHFNAAVRGYVSYQKKLTSVRTAANSNLAQIYLAYREGVENPKIYEARLRSVLGETVSLPFQKRPFLRLLHAIVVETTGVKVEDEVKRQISRMVSALEIVDQQFSKSSGLTLETIQAYIKDSGGISGLYSTRRRQGLQFVRKGKSTGGDKVKRFPLPTLGVEFVVKPKGKHLLRLPELPAGYHDINIRVGRDGTIRELYVYESEDAKVA